MTMTLRGGRNEPLKKHNYTVTLREGKWEVKVSPTTGYGYFEHDDYGEGGGLWFEDQAGTLSLADFDGRMVLPKDVGTALRGAGYNVDDIFD